MHLAVVLRLVGSKIPVIDRATDSTSGTTRIVSVTHTSGVLFTMQGTAITPFTVLSSHLLVEQGLVVLLLLLGLNILVFVVLDVTLTLVVVGK